MRTGEPIGGYFELETHGGTEYWKDPLRMNTARNCLRHIVRGFGIRKLYVPRYTCPVVWDAVCEEQCEMEYYSVDFNLMPLSEFPADAYILYTNYLGICTKNANCLAKKYPQLITDCAQAFYSAPMGIASFYSPRKFFGVPDGAYLFADGISTDGLEQDASANRFLHLLARTEQGAQMGYPVFLRNEDALCREPVKTMSKLTRKLLEGIPYDSAAQARRSNYAALHAALGNINEWSGIPDKDDVPMAYPFLCKKEGLREKLIQENIFIPTFWKGQKDAEVGKYMEQYLLPLPVDQRYGSKDMQHILDCIFQYL